MLQDVIDKMVDDNQEIIDEVQAPEVVNEVPAAAEEVTVEPEEYKMGKVIAKELYIRTAPDKNAAPYETTLKEGAEVMIDESKSTEEFYSVVTESGIEGFCMKKFVAVQ